MQFNINILTLPGINIFWPVFSEVLKYQFPGYSETVVKYLLEKIYTLYAFEYWLKIGEKTIIAAYDRDKIVGFAVIDRAYGGVSFCRWLGVLPEFQRKGIGKKLINEWTNIAINSGCHKIEVASQPEAKDFYQKSGLKLEGKRELSYFGIDQYIFGKVIGKPNDLVMTSSQT